MTDDKYNELDEKIEDLRKGQIIHTAIMAFITVILLAIVCGDLHASTLDTLYYTTDSSLWVGVDSVRAIQDSVWYVNFYPVFDTTDVRFFPEKYYWEPTFERWVEIDKYVLMLPRHIIAVVPMEAEPDSVWVDNWESVWAIKDTIATMRAMPPHWQKFIHPRKRALVIWEKEDR